MSYYSLISSTDFVLGLTTCALFLSLKYHRLHPEYIYQRIRNLQGKYNLRIILAMVDIPNHEDSLRELSKTSLIGVIAGWGTIKVNKWIAAVDEPFRAKKAAKRKLVHDESTEDRTPSRLDQARPIGRVPLREMSSMGGASADTPPIEAVPSGEVSARKKSGAQRPAVAADEDDEDAMIAAAIEESKITARAEASQRTEPSQRTESAASSRAPDELTDGIAAALARLRDGG
ncbi:Mating-type switching protein swi10 like [Verticillium longisporum]|nr:Mating-type switching protein swi10 like [Verticillium longisporum]